MPRAFGTKRTIEARPCLPRGQIIYRDVELTGFGLHVGTRSKVFIVESQVAKRPVRVTLGRYGLVSREQARKLALTCPSGMAQGSNPNLRKRRVDAGAITLRLGLCRFFDARPALSEAIRASYSRTLNLHLSDWTDRPITEITRSMVLHRHHELSADRGSMTADTVMRRLWSVYNFLASTAEGASGLPPNPVAILWPARVWAPEKRRQGLIPVHVLPAWYEVVVAEGPLARDFLLMALLMGMQRWEIAGLRWEHIDLKGRTLTVPKTENGDPLTLPLSSYLTRPLMERKLRVGTPPWVFPTRSGKGHLQECESFTNRVGARCDHSFTVHDLRRTFITIAEALGISAYGLKRLLNHHMSGDVTSGYIIIDVERLREPVEQIANSVHQLMSLLDEHPVAIASEPR